MLEVSVEDDESLNVTSSTAEKVDDFPATKLAISSSNFDESQQNRMQRFENLVNSLTKEKVSTQSQLLVITQEKIHLEKMLDDLQKEKNHALEERNEFEIMLRESDAYAKTLREHVDELEQMGTTFHRQREEQNEYFLQKELNMKQKAKSQLTSALTEIDELKRELLSSREQKQMLQDELELIRNEKDELLAEKYEKKKERESLRQRLKALENDVEIEQETVQMLSEKNSKLSSRLAVMERNLSESKTRNSAKGDGQLSPREIGKIDEMLQKKTKIHQEEIQLRDQQIIDLNQKVAKSEALLSSERRSKQDALSRISMLESEVTKLRKNSQILISYASRSNTISSSRHHNNLLMYKSYLNNTTTFSTPPPTLNMTRQSDHCDVTSNSSSCPSPELHSTPHNLSFQQKQSSSSPAVSNDQLNDLSMIENCVS